MSMTVAEFFVELGFKGDGQTKAVKGLTAVQTSLVGVKNTALEVKAAIIAAFYALERLTSASASYGNSLKNFQTNTGLSAEKLQQFQFAGEMTEASFEETQGALENLQQTMVKFTRGEGTPLGMRLYRSFLQEGGFNPEDAFGNLEKLQKAIQSQKGHQAFTNEEISSFINSDKVVAGMRQGNFNPEVYRKALVYNEKQLDILQKINFKWFEIKNTIAHIFGDLTTQFGGRFISAIKALLPDLRKFLTELAKIVTSKGFLDTVRRFLVAILTLLTHLGRFTVGMEKFLGLGEDDKKNKLPQSVFSKFMTNVIDKPLDWVLKKGIHALPGSVKGYMIKKGLEDSGAKLQMTEAEARKELQAEGVPNVDVVINQIFKGVKVKEESRTTTSSFNRNGGK